MRFLEISVLAGGAAISLFAGAQAARLALVPMNAAFAGRLSSADAFGQGEPPAVASAAPLAAVYQYDAPLAPPPAGDTRAAIVHVRYERPAAPADLGDTDAPNSGDDAWSDGQDTSAAGPPDTHPYAAVDPDPAPIADGDGRGQIVADAGDTGLSEPH